MEEMYLYGAGGHSKVILDILKENQVAVAAVIDDNRSIDRLMDIPVIHEEIHSPLIISVGDNRVRKTIATRLEGVTFGKGIAQSAIVSESASVGEGSVVMQRAVIQSSVRIGQHVIVNTGATIDHDCVIQDYVHIAPGCTLCGNVEVGEGALVGAGTVIIPGVRIGKWCVIGAGSVVCKDIPDQVMAMGSPCKVIKTIAK